MIVAVIVMIMAVIMRMIVMLVAVIMVIRAVIVMIVAVIKYRSLRNLFVPVMMMCRWAVFVVVVIVAAVVVVAVRMSFVFVMIDRAANFRIQIACRIAKRRRLVWRAAKNAE